MLKDPIKYGIMSSANIQSRPSPREREERRKRRIKRRARGNSGTYLEPVWRQHEGRGDAADIEIDVKISNAGDLVRRYVIVEFD